MHELKYHIELTIGYMRVIKGECNLLKKVWWFRFSRVSKNKRIDGITKGTILFKHEPIQFSQLLKKFCLVLRIFFKSTYFHIKD